MRQEALRSRLLLEVDLATIDAKSVVDGLSPEELEWRPPKGGWSVGQVLEHLVLADESYFSRMRSLVYDHVAPHGRVGEDARWEPTLAGWFLVSSMRSDRPLPGPSAWKPQESPRPAVWKAFLDRQTVLVQLLRAAAALDWNHIKTSSPFSRLVRLNLGDCFSVLVVHTQRHVRQMQRVKAEMPRTDVTR